MATQKDVIVRSCDLWKVYKSSTLEVVALRGIDLEVRRGEMVAIMGPSGCGKTTLLNCLSGLDEPTRGEVYIEGRNLAAMSDDERTEYRARKIGFIFQTYNLIPVITALENVTLPLLIAGVKRRTAEERGLKTLELVGLKGLEHKFPNEMSGGQQQRVAIARSLVTQPAIIFADEPTGNLDTETSRRIMELISRLHREMGQTYILVTHDPKVASYSDRIIYMENGKIIKTTRN